MPGRLGMAGAIARTFITSKLTPLIAVASILLGAGAVWLLPREEEPQIVVPMIDVAVEMPGASPEEIETRVTQPMEKLLWEVPGVEYIYSTSSPGRAFVIVRFIVGTNEEDAIVRLNQKMLANYDLIPPGCSEPLIKPRSIDDVPILALTLSSSRYDAYTLRRIAAQVHDAVTSTPLVSEAKLIGGERRQLRVMVDKGRLASRGLGIETIAARIGQANARTQAGAYDLNNREWLVETGAFLRDAADVRRVVVGVYDGRPVYLGDVADVVDGPEEPVNYVFNAEGPSARFGEMLQQPSEEEGALFEPAVTISVAKRKGANAISVAGEVLHKVEELRGTTIPSDVRITIARNYGETAAEKSNELLFHMALAIFSVWLLMAFALGLRESGAVAVAIPVTLSLTLVVFYLYGYTINRVTLFALIFSIGILVDDAIVVVENIVRHFHLPGNEHRPVRELAVEAVDEVGNPTILATFAVIAAILPMAFVRGLMGPYMEPIPIGASAAMLFSVLISFVVTPWAAHLMLRRGEAPEGRIRAAMRRVLRRTAKPAKHDHGEGALDRFYRRLMGHLIEQAKWRTGFLALVLVLFVLACALVPLNLVRVKMLPFDNKSEFQVIIDMPEGTPLEETQAVTRELSDYLRTVPEVTNLQTYAGAASPHNFNGLVRHYFLRNRPNEADIQVNLAPKSERSTQSHDIAKRVRPALTEIAREHGARIKVAEVPPGPPVLQTLVAEVYGPDYAKTLELAKQVRDVFEQTEGVVDVDSYIEDDQSKQRFTVDAEKAALNGVSVDTVNAALRLALSGERAGLLHQPQEKEDVPIVVQLPRAERSGVERLGEIKIPAMNNRLVSLAELVRVTEGIEDKGRYRKNLLPVVYVTADVGGKGESPVYVIFELMRKVRALRAPDGAEVAQLSTRQPFSSEGYTVKWDGEWFVTYEVFRDMGLAFAAVLVLIFILVVGWFQSLKTPFVIMAAIPFSLVGILPAHWLIGAFFTATSMIGFIAGAGIVVRNSIILVDFIELRLTEGMPLPQAVVDAGAVRFRPMLLTAAAVMVGASVILFDPIFQGLALSLMAGELASLLLSRMAVPVLYYLARK